VADRGPGTLGVHRDTWASNVYAQTNWWTPIRPLSEERTIAIYPGYWEQPIANSSADWDLEVVRAQARGELRSPCMPLAPEPSERVDRSSELRIVPEPGDLLCFSGAHLHASIPNTSRETRFSVEVRTLLLDDILARRAAPNLDGKAPHVPIEWFRRITDGAPLPAELRSGAARAAGAAIEFEHSAPLITDRSLYRELVKRAIARTVVELEAQAAEHAAERQAARDAKRSEPASPLDVAEREERRQLVRRMRRFRPSSRPLLSPRRMALSVASRWRRMARASGMNGASLEREAQSIQASRC
jgi:hypothetical protein